MKLAASGDGVETDYLVVGAGAAGMAFTDALLTHSDATVTIVDRRHAPGGHWLDAYPFVRLHQPSAFYGVDSVPLGNDAIERTGLNAGFYEMAGADELCAYYDRVMQHRFLPTGRVRFLPCTDYQGREGGGHRVTSRLSGTTQEVRVRRKLVDATYMEGSIPATGKPPFEVAPGVRFVPAGGIAGMTDRAERYCVIGAGKTALDTCVWLLEQGVPPERIRWIKPREAWWLNRRYHQPHEMLPDFHAGGGLQVRAMAEARSMDDLFARLEAEGFFLRVDQAVAPTMLHGAIASEAEIEQLRRIRDVVRLGKVRRIARDRIVLDDGEVPTDDGTVHVHCAAQGLRHPPLRPIFASDRVSVQPTAWGFFSFQVELLGVVESLVGSDDEKNRLCPPIAYWDRPADYLSAYLAVLASERARAAYPAVAAWAKTSRLNPLGGLGKHRDDPRVLATKELFKQVAAAGVANAGRLLASRAAGPR